MTRLALAIVVLLALPVVSEGQDIDAIVRQAAARRREYVEAFKSLTATETRVAERLDKNGALERRRTVVSDFLVYPSGIKTGEVNEYRIVREVDGKPVGDASAAMRTFQRLAGSKTQRQEFERLRDVNAKYSIGYATWGSTINQLGAFRDEFRDRFEFAVVGRDRIGERDVMIVSFRSKDFRAVEPITIYRQFKQPRAGSRGRVWLDAETWRAQRSESETVAVGEGITTPVLLMRYDVEYGPSAFDLLTPRKIVVSFFDRSERKTPQIRWLNARITYTYDAFKRFEVATSTDIQLPKQ